MTPLGVAQAALKAGIRTPQQLAEAVAIALAESGGNERAHNRVPPDNSYGLWQINMYQGLGVARRTQFNLTNDAELFDPDTNARAMMAISNGGTNWKPWTTYKGARYVLSYPIAVSAATAALAGSGAQAAAGAATGVVTDTVDAAVDAAQKLQKAGAWLSDRNNWWRVAKVILGGAVVIAGVAVLARPAVEGATNMINPIRRVIGK